MLFKNLSIIIRNKIQKQSHYKNYKNQETKRHTKELSKNASEEAQIARNIVSHGRWKGLNDRINTKHSLKKLIIS